MAKALTIALVLRQTAEIESARTAWLLASDLAARSCQADVRQVLQTKGTRGRRIDSVTARARGVACYLAVIVGNNPPSKLAIAADMDRKTIQYYLTKVEDERDDPTFDRMLDELAEVMVRMAVRIVMANLGEGALGEAA